jgi:drug/metabolite transporter (DMT)-like permease
MGLLGIFLAILIKTAAISIAGFAAGAYIVYSLLPMINFDLGNYYWLVVIVGGVLGAILAGTMFDWALIILTAASGAVLVSQTLDLTYPLSAVVLVVLFLIGLIVQGNMKSKD